MERVRSMEVDLRGRLVRRPNAAVGMVSVAIGFGIRRGGERAVKHADLSCIDASLRPVPSTDSGDQISW